MEQSKKRKYMLIIGPLVLFITLFGLTYAFFNYTRTGTVNNLGTGQIYFNTTEGPTLNLTNLFPMTSEEASNANLDSVSVVIEGNTTYSDGEEYEITIVDVNNTVNGKKIPLNYTATYTPNTDKVIGTASNDYWNAREDKDDNIYLLKATGEVEEGKQVLVGYVDNGATGIEGTLTIKAYIDKDRIAISDTYPNYPVYIFNTNMTTTEYNYCVTYLSDFMDVEHYPLPTGQSIEAFCQGTGTIEYYGVGNMTFQQFLDKNNELYAFSYEDFDALESHGVIHGYLNGTTVGWVDGRTVLTTSEWNSLSSTPISFKIRAESNEGIWLPNVIESCPNCKFIYRVDTEMYTAWNTYHYAPTVITSGVYNDYKKLMEDTGKSYFLGINLNVNNEITEARVCGVKDNVPFCLEPSTTGSSYAPNLALLQSADLYNNTCEVSQYIAKCGSWSDNNTVAAQISNYGFVRVGTHESDEIDSNNKYCYINPYGVFECYDN